MRAQSLARDLDKLVTHGYRIARLQPLDMFPQTEQVENVVLLERTLEGTGFRCQVSGFSPVVARTRDQRC